jgi:dihydroxyacetone kinase
VSPTAETGNFEKVALVQRAVVAAAVALEQAQDELCRLDAAAGDGDEGLAMAMAARGVQKRLTEQPPTSVADIVRHAASELSAVGGAMGALSYVIVSAVGDHLDEEGAFTAARLGEFLAAAEDGVATFGGASRGDKSILDAIGSARDAAEEAARGGATAAAAVAASAAAAREGAQATAEMEARIGRASRLGEHSRGSVDAGAQTFALVLSALSDAYASNKGGPA